MAQSTPQTPIKPALQQAIQAQRAAGALQKPVEQTEVVKFKYRVLGGKHFKGDQIVGVKGDIVELTEEEAAGFLNKFEKVEEETEE